MTSSELYDLICFEKIMFKIKDNNMNSHSHPIHKNYPYLTNSFNVFQEIFDFNPHAPGNCKRELDMAHFIETLDF